MGPQIFEVPSSCPLKNYIMLEVFRIPACESGEEPDDMFLVESVHPGKSGDFFGPITRNILIVIAEFFDRYDVAGVILIYQSVHALQYGFGTRHLFVHVEMIALNGILMYNSKCASTTSLVFLDKG